MSNVADEIITSPSVASVVITGLVIVFSMLLFFVLLFSVFGKLMNVATKPKTEVKPVKSVKPVKKAVPAEADNSVNSARVDDDEIIAVISAAVYAMYEGSSKRPVIKSIRPSSRSGKSAWAMAGIYNNIKSF